MRKIILRFFGWIGVPMTLVLLPVFLYMGWYFKKGLNAFELIERAEIFTNLCGMVTFVLLAGLLSAHFLL